ncbi:MAG: tetratricopeptide repeat protein [Alphaproteobacteria bacterium]|nr:tetratricopeptide repeat protein [Alphaproteobacteria bacterium]
MTEHNIFAEIQEDLEREKLEALWKKYGPWVVIAALGIVLATASSTAYRSWQAQRNQRLTSALLDTTKGSADDAKNIDLLQKFAGEYPGSVQADLALLQAGAFAVDHNDKAKAIKIFDQVAADAKANPAFRQLGDLLSVQTQLDSGDPAALSARLLPLTEEKAPWRYSALEDQAYLALRAGDKAKAKQIFTDLSQDARAPQSIGARAADILHSLD